MIVAGFTDSWESSIDAVAKGEKVIVMTASNQQ